MVVGQAQMDEIQTIDVLILGGGAAAHDSDDGCQSGPHRSGAGTQ